MGGVLVFLGTGGSMGIPVIGCSCEVCRSDSPFNKRLRSSVWITYDEKEFIIDVGPDFRQQCIKFQIHSVDGVLITHAHYDHIAAIDDLRPLTFKKSPLPVLLSKYTAEEVTTRCHYLLKPDPVLSLPSRLSLEIFDQENGTVDFHGIPVQYVTYLQSGMKVNGYKIGNLAYLTDIKDFSPTIFEELKNVKYLVISALRYTSSPLHFSIDDAIEFSHKINAEQVWLTHISHELEYHQTNAYLPSNIRVAYDGLKIEFN